MPPLPIIKPAEAIKVFCAFGWEIARQKGSHIIMTKEGSYCSLSIPNHSELARGTLRSLIVKSGISFEDFLLQLKN